MSNMLDIALRLGDELISDPEIIPAAARAEIPELLPAHYPKFGSGRSLLEIIG
jgi:hypothetical protein